MGCPCHERTNRASERPLTGSSVRAYVFCVLEHMFGFTEGPRARPKRARGKGRRTIARPALMSKRYEEPIDVETTDVSVDAFWWRGKRYQVRQVLCRWRE